nr:hypothetical protein [Mycoplasmopsis bovis]
MLLDSINDENNLINLPKQSSWLVWSRINSHMYLSMVNIFLLDNELKINELYEFDKCTKIPNIYLNEKRKEYIALRNQFRKNNIYMILTKVILNKSNCSFCCLNDLITLFIMI